MYESKTKIIPAKRLEELRAESREIDVDVVFEDDFEDAGASATTPDELGASTDGDPFVTQESAETYEATEAELQELDEAETGPPGQVAYDGEDPFASMSMHAAPALRTPALPRPAIAMPTTVAPVAPPSSAATDPLFDSWAPHAPAPSRPSHSSITQSGTQSGSQAGTLSGSSPPPAFPSTGTGRVAAIPPTAPPGVPRPSPPRPGSHNTPPMPKKA